MNKAQSSRSDFARKEDSSQDDSSQTEIDIVFVDGEKQVVNRRSIDARIWGGMSEEEQLKAERLAAGYSIATDGMRITGSNYGALPGSTAGTRISGGALVHEYKRWLLACACEGVDPSAAIQILVYGHSFATVDRATRKRRHTSRTNMIAALDLF